MRSITLVLVLTLVATPAVADSLSELRARAGRPDVDLDELEEAVRPLSRAALGEVAGLRFHVLRRKVADLGRARLRADDSRAEALRRERDALIDQLEVVLASLEAKGGDVEEIRQYVAAVKGRSELWHDVWSWIASGEGGLRWLLRIGLFVLVIVVSRFAARLLGRLTHRAVDSFRQGSKLLKDFLANTVRRIVFFVGLVVALSFLGIDVGPFLAAIGAIGFIIGFALQGTLNNLASGVMILLYHPYDLGDVVTVAGVTGSVEEMHLASTTILKADNQVVVVPNGKIWGDIITNATGNDTRRADMTFQVAYDEDPARVEAVLNEIVAAHPLVLDEPEPTIRLTDLGESAVTFVVRPWAKTGDVWAVTCDVTRSVKERFDAEGITIPFPQREVRLHSAGAEA